MGMELPDAVYQWFGHLGVAFYLGSYALLQAGVIRGSSITYTVLNMAAASCVLMSLLVAFNLSSALIQISWIMISVVGLTRMAIQTRRVRFTPAEQTLLETVLPSMPKPVARRFFNAGTWHDAKPGTLLTQEAEPVEALHYLARGRAGVFSGGKQIAEIQSGFVGELNVMEAGPASATVQLATDAVIFTISGQSLRQMADRDSDFRLILDRALTRDTAYKLRRANKALAESAA